MKKEIDVIILSNNEEEVIEDALKSAKGWANIIVVDSGSTDRTEEIASSYDAKFVKNKFKNFSDQRNFAFKKSEAKWVMYLDSDERLTEEFKKELTAKIQEHNYSGFEIKRKTYYYGKDWGFEDKVARIFRADKFKEWKGVVHETAYFDGELGIINNPIIHFTHRNLSQMVEKTNKWSEYEAKLRYDAKHPRMKAWRFIRVMGSEFYRSYFRQKGYKNGTYGLVEALYQSYSMFITYAKLWEIQKNKN